MSSESGQVLIDTFVERGLFLSWMKDNHWLCLDELRIGHEDNGVLRDCGTIVEAWLSPSGVMLEFVFQKEPEDKSWVIDDWKVSGNRKDSNLKSRPK